MSDTNDPKPYPSMSVRVPKPAIGKTPMPGRSGSGAPTSDFDTEALNIRVAELREKRVPFGRRSQKLAYASRPGYHRHWFADHPGRVEEARAAGWENVKDDAGKTVTKLSGRHRDGRAMIGYLMEIPEVLWREDLAADQARVNSSEDSIRQGQVAANPTGERQNSFYVPAQGISLKNETAKS